VALQILKRARAIAEGLGVVRVDGQGLVVACERLGRAGQISERVAAMVEDTGGVRVDRQGLIVTCERLGWAFQASKSASAIAEDIGGARLDRQRLVVAREGLGKSALLVSQDAETMQNNKMVGPAVENLQIQTFGRGKISLTMKISSLFEQLR
jgi:hypothetical protein